ncbi:MoxR family ATPase [Emticicia sp. BO119]|uniref:AAA family ATPase n=1 Tax=Emticicia sp. BO119 TaxID=2757768 RepID=UPI0015F0CFAB|nr:MoxR family ATPase [Emticicia sp. BO119]MBA4852386.1 MoxR family ATPase [Emticicia sp. BO119]
MEKLYAGKALLKAQPDYDENGEELSVKIPPYLPSESLKKAVEYARLLNRPLLIRGEPGSGKTRLAQAIAFELYGKEYRKYFFEWYVKSTTKATEGLYTYDYLANLRDSQNKSNEQLPEKEEYVVYGPMAKAFQSQKQAILLIDEIDKADIDFPNDLLLELDQKRFFIKELNKKGELPHEEKAKNSPIVIITSNDEKELPNAFLRRCVFHYIDLDESDDLDNSKENIRISRRMEIVKAHIASFSENSKQGELLSDEVIKDIVSRFISLVNEMKANNAIKKPDTSELLDWVRIIHYFWLSGSDIKEILLKKEIPYPEILLKNLEDFSRFSKLEL